MLHYRSRILIPEDRWLILVHKSAKVEGDSRSLDIKDEFRCLIAALYGKGTATAPDVALRCAFYGNAELTAREMRQVVSVSVSPGGARRA